MPWHRTLVSLSTRMATSSSLLCNGDDLGRSGPHVRAIGDRTTEIDEARTRELGVVSRKPRHHRQRTAGTAHGDAEPFRNGVAGLHAAAMDVEEDRACRGIIEQQAEAVSH